MRLWSKIRSYFRRQPRNAPPPLDISSRLDGETLEKVMREARFLHAQGASARELSVGEEATETPRIGE